MKSTGGSSGNSKLRQAGFVIVCLLLMTGGLGTKVAVERFAQIQDEIETSFMQPTPVHVANHGDRGESAEITAKR